MLSATGPNRTYLWSGTINTDQEHGSYIASNGGDELGDFLPWQCYPVTLQNAGVTWKIYQGTDNYGDNGAQYFATVPEPLNYETYNGDNLANAIKADVKAGTLPQVAWVVTNQQYSEHPDGAPTDGAYYVGKVLQALNADPEVFNSTLVIIDYDENDGAFDHVPPPAAPQGTTDEFVLETSVAPAPLPVGLGFRVPLFLISPWTRGGWVTSEVSDHTSVLQFLEKWTTAIGKPAICPNISEWRRAVSGDLLNALDFANPVYGLPDLPFVSAPAGEANSYEVVPTTNTPDLTYTITHTQYSPQGPKSYKVLAGQPEKVVVDPLASSHGWYDLTITIDGDSTWSQRYTGHLETGGPSITGAV